MKLKDILGFEEDLYAEESDWETEIEAAVEDAKLWGLGFFIVFEDSTMARVGFEEMDEVMAEWRKKIALS